MPEHHLHRVIWSPLQVSTYTLGDLADALVFLHNIRLIDDDELKRLAEKAERRWPAVDTDAAERIAEIEDEIRQLEEGNEADRERLARLPKESWPLESFDPHSELTKERDGYRADQEAEQRQREQWGG